jgi:hypothetical protein
MVYHHNFHLWYRMVYIGGIGVLLEVLSRWHKRNIWFFHFPLVIWPKKFQISNNNFHFKFKKWKFSIFSFQISTTKNFNFFHFHSRDIPQKFSFPFDGMAKIFQIWIHKSKSNFFSIFPISLWWYYQNFKIQKQKFSIQISKTKKQILSFQIFLVA